MLFIVGKAVLYPQGRITHAHLSAAWPQHEMNRENDYTTTTLTQEQLSQLSSVSGSFSAQPPSFVPSDLGAEAVRAVCHSEGIAPEEIGMILGETATPEQTIPGISHRVGKRLNTKPYAFDLFNGFVSLAQMAEALLSHKVETLPPYIACVASHLLTTRLSYAAPSRAAQLLSDAASAVIVSPTVKSSITLTGARVGTFALPPQSNRFERLVVADDFFVQGARLEAEVLESLPSHVQRIGILSNLKAHAQHGLSGTPNMVAALGLVTKPGRYGIALGDHLVEVEHA